MARRLAAVACRGVAKSGSVSLEEEGEMRFVVVQEGRPRHWRKTVEVEAPRSFGNSWWCFLSHLFFGHRQTRIRLLQEPCCPRTDRHSGGSVPMTLGRGSKFHFEAPTNCQCAIFSTGGHQSRAALSKEHPSLGLICHMSELQLLRWEKVNVSLRIISRDAVC